MRSEFFNELKGGITMAKPDKKQAGPEAPQASVSTHCKSQGCKKPEAKFTFCGEHYEWFKFGLINKAGAKVRDFDKKWDAYVAHGFTKVQKVA